MREFRDQVLEIARRRLPDARFAYGPTDEDLQVGANRVYLGNLLAGTRMIAPEDREAEIVGFLSVIVRDLSSGRIAEAPIDWSDVEPLLRPKLVAKEALDPLPDVLHREFSAKVALAYGLDRGTYDTFVVRDMPAAWGVTPAIVEKVAIGNLESMSVSVALPAIRDEGIALFGCNDAYDASRILLPGLRQRLLAGSGPTLFAGIPGRDAFVLWLRDSPIHIGCVSWVREAATTEPHPLTDEIFVITKDGVRVASADEIASRTEFGV